MDELRQQVADLEIQEREIIGRLNAAETDEEAKSITNELNFVRNRKAEVELELSKQQEKEQQRAEVIEEKVQAEAIPFEIAGVDFTGLAAPAIKAIERIVLADRRRMLKEHAIEIEQVEQQLAERTEAALSLSNQLSELNKTHIDYVQLQNEIVHDLDLRISDAEQKRDAAVREKEEAFGYLENAQKENELMIAEINRLKAEIEDLKRTQEYNHRQTEQVIVNDEEKAEIQAAVDELKKYFTTHEDWGSAIKVNKPDGGFELVKRKEFEAEWSPVDVPSFRPEDTDADAQSDQLSIAETAATVEPPAFREEEPAVQTDVLLREGATEGLGDVAQVTREEFQALVKRVEALEGNAVQEAA